MVLFDMTRPMNFYTIVHEVGGYSRDSRLESWQGFFFDTIFCVNCNSTRRYQIQEKD